MRKLDNKHQQQLVCCFEVYLRAWNLIVIGHYTINTPKIFQVFTLIKVTSSEILLCFQASSCYPGSNEDCAAKGFSMERLERAEASFCESTANDSAGVLV